MSLAPAQTSAAFTHKTLPFFTCREKVLAIKISRRNKAMGPGAGDDQEPGDFLDLHYF